MTEKSSILNRNLGSQTFVPKHSKTMNLGSPGSQNSFWRVPGSAKGEPEAHKGRLRDPNSSHRGCFETSLGSLGTAWWGSGTCLGDSRGPFWSNIRSKTQLFCCKLFWSCFLEVFKLTFIWFCFSQPYGYTVIYNGFCMFSGLVFFRKVCKVCMDKLGKITQTCCFCRCFLLNKCWTSWRHVQNDVKRAGQAPK